MSLTVVEAVYFIPSKILAQKEFSIEAKFKDILDYFNTDLYPQYQGKIIPKKNYY